MVNNDYDCWLQQNVDTVHVVLYHIVIFCCYLFTITSYLLLFV